MHIIGPEQGWTQPGMTIVCGDSHTATHGAFGALAHGIGTSRGRACARHPDADPAQGEEHEGRGHAAASAPASPPRTSRSRSSAPPAPPAAPATSSNTAGEAIRALSMEGRMTVCNMAIEGGARAGLIAPDEKTFAYVKGRAHAPKGGAWELAEAYWRTLFTDEGARLRQAGDARRRRHRPGRHLGHQPRGRAADHRRRPATPRTSPAARSTRRGARSTTWA